MAIRQYNLKKDIVDPRDWKFEKLSAVVPKSLPLSVDLRPLMPNVVDQGNLGSCTANAIGGAFQYSKIKQKLPAFPPSRLFVYYNERLIEGTVNVDAGAYLRNGIKVINTYGICPETVWPYNISQFRVRPSQTAYDQAKPHKALAYYRVNVTVDDMKSAVAAGFPVIIGMLVYSSFESSAVTKTGTVPMPGKKDRLLGGHAVLITGYNDSTQRFSVRNSWGTSWGDKGYFTVPYAYANPSLMSDCWVVQTVS